MLRMGKNPNEEKSPTQPDTNRSYSPYQSGETYARPATENAATPKALTDCETIAREIKDGTLSGFVGSGTSITGEATFKAMLRIDGRFSGKITSSSGTLLVGAGGQVDANVDVAVALIQGIVNGDIIAGQRVELGRASKLSGNIQTPSLVIEQGAVFEGSCKMIQQGGADKSQKLERKENLIDSSISTPARVEPPAKKIEDAVAKKPETANVAAAS